MTGEKVLRLFAAIVFAVLAVLLEYIVIRQLGRHVFGVPTFLFVQILPLYLISVTVRLMRRD